MRTLGVKSKICALFFATCLFFIFLSGCGQVTYDKTTLEMRKNGIIALHIVDAFDNSKYSFDEFKSFNESEVSAYNGLGKGTVTIEGCTVEGNTLRLDMSYSDGDAYYDINKVVLYYGTATNARNLGYNLVGKVTSTMGDGVLDKAGWDGLSSQKVVIVSEEIEVHMPGKILYAGEGVTLTGADMVAVSGEGLHYIISE